MDDQVNDQTGVVKEFVAPLYQCKGWMKLTGVTFIIMGALYALTLIGIIVAWLPLWIGILLFQSASGIELAYLSGDRNTMSRSLAKLKTYFVIMGVMTLIGIVFWIIALVFAVMMPVLQS